LAYSRQESLLDSKSVHGLLDHDGRVPVSKGIGDSGPGVSVTKRLNCDQVHRVDELRILELAAEELGASGEGVNKDQRRLILTVRLCHAVRDIDATQVMDMDGFGHCGID
jgi:hypothetical protein